MKIIKLNLKNRSYKIVVGSNILEALGRYIVKLNIGKDAYIITNAAIKNRYGARLNKTLKNAAFKVKFRLIPDTEKSKSIEIASALMKDLASYDKKRRIFILAFGGGVVGDLSGFVASIYKRGIPYLQVPTTLLAQVDSSVGGKTAIDLIWGKNLVGAFYQPRLVYSDVNILKTLSQRQLQAGLSEVIKYGIIKDPDLFNYLERNLKSIFNLKTAALEFVVARSIAIKAKIVEQDEKEEKKIRTILNFGHTLGHAIEAASSYTSYNHGEAIALGMLLAADLSQQLGLIDKEVSLRIENLIEAAGLPTKIKRISLPSIIEAYYHDKKFIGAKNRFVLLKGIGRTKIVEDIPLKIIKKVLKERIV
ncbi:MAG: 3-dehydroquinate synthase [Candidatus Omnitrophica bacterium]|nr:3-dehydroquinate synthase [Candidatus Omnitrophota bacterium]